MDDPEKTAFLVTLHGKVQGIGLRARICAAALYVIPRTALSLARALHDDLGSCKHQAGRARRNVASQFSYDMHIERLRQAGVKLNV